MGNRAYLVDSSGQELFEANNSLPGLWLALLDLECVERAVSALEAAWLEDLSDTHEAGDDGDMSSVAPDSAISLPTSRALATLSRRMPAVQHAHPELAGLIEDFAAHLGANASDELSLDLLQIAHFTSLDDFLESLRSEIRAFDTEQIDQLHYLWPHDPIAGGTGFAAWSDSTFADASPHYRRWLNDRRDAGPLPTGTPGTGTVGALVGWGLALAICPVFTWLTIVGYRQEGLSGTVMLLGLANIGFYLFVGWSFFGECVKFKERTSQSDPAD